MSETAFDHEVAPEALAAQVNRAQEQLEQLAGENTQLARAAENQNWDLSAIHDANRRLAEIRDGLSTVAEKIGRAQQVADSYRENRMVGDKATLDRN